MSKHSSFLGMGNCNGFPLKTGSTGDNVKEVQTLLGVTADGSFGPATEAAAMRHFGSNTITCQQYKQLSGKGITTEKVQGGLNLASSVLSMLGNRNQHQHQQFPQQQWQQPQRQNNTLLFVLIGVIVVGLIGFIIVKK